MRVLVFRTLCASVLAGSVAACASLPPLKPPPPIVRVKPPSAGDQQVAAFSNNLAENCNSLRIELGLARSFARTQILALADRASIVIDEFCRAPPQSDEEAVAAINRILEALIALKREQIK